MSVVLVIIIIVILVIIHQFSFFFNSEVLVEESWSIFSNTTDDRVADFITDSIGNEFAANREGVFVLTRIELSDAGVGFVLSPMAVKEALR